MSYLYNNAQQIISINENVAGTSLPSPKTFEYDDRDQLKKEKFNNYSETYTYDKAQNRLSKGKDYTAPDTFSYVIANKLTNIHIGVQSADNQYFYDIAGNLSSNVKNDTIKTVIDYYYNAQNKLCEIHKYYNVGNSRAHQWHKLKYDSQNRRIALSQNDTWRYTIHDGNIPIAETDNSGNVSRWFVRGVGIAEGTGDMIAEITGYDPYSVKIVYYLSNHRGDTMLAYRDDNGTETLVARYLYDAFGNRRTDSNYCYENQNETDNLPRYTFSTKEYLSDAELYLYAYRVYDPIAGRWTQRDPIDYQDSINLYRSEYRGIITRIGQSKGCPRRVIVWGTL